MASPPNQQNNYKYNGIEFDEDLSINIDEAFYRSHDPQLGRFWQIDPKIEGAEAWSPYSAMLDNPILNTDPLGDSSRPWIRLWGGVKALGGLGEMAMGGALAIGTSWTGAGAVGGAALVAHGADVTATGVLQLWSGKEASTFTEQAISSGLQKAGVSEGTASTVATIADGAFGIAGIGLGSMAARASKAGDFSLRSISTGSAPTSELGEESISLSAAKGGGNIKYLGRMEDLEGIPRSQTIIDDLPNLGSPKANYYQNMSVIRRNLREGVTFKDASWFRPNSELAPTISWPTRTVGQTFYGAERNLMQNRGLWPK